MRHRLKRTDKRKPICAMHAFGMYKGQTYTNSKEAFDYWYSKGIRFYETDVARTDAGKFMLHHNFKKKRNCILTQYTLKGFVNLVSEHKDCRFVIDTYGVKDAGLDEFMNQLSSTGDSNPQGLAETKLSQNDFWKRVFIETYSSNMTEMIKNSIKKLNTQPLLISCIRGCEGESGYSGENAVALADILKEQDIRWVSYPWSDAKRDNELIDVLHNNKIRILSLSRTNIGSARKRKYHINVNLVDFYISPCTFKNFIANCMQRVLIKLDSICTKNVEGTKLGQSLYK